MTIDPELLIKLGAAKSVVVLTGAGISAESGIPTFRDTMTGLWSKFKPHDLATPEAFDENPKLVWDWYAWRRKNVAQAEPNAGHYALVELEKRYPQFLLATQNVDGLHARAGSKQLVELHGNIGRVKCSRCATIAGTWLDGENVPQCPSCIGLLRPDVVWFGESLPEADFESATEAARSCEIFFSIGTSAMVFPAAGLIRVAHRGGATIVEINPDATPFSELAHFTFRGASGITLPEIIKQTWPL